MKIIAALGLALGLVACTGKKEADQMTKHADELCACKTVECAQKLMPAIEKFAKDNEGKEVDRDHADRYNAQMDRAGKCIERLVDEAEKAAKPE